MALILGLAGFATIGVLLLLLRTWPVINVVETGQTPEYPGITPRTYQAEASRVFDAALHAVDRLPRWMLSSYQADKGEIRAEARTLIFRFVDDVVIHIVGSDGSAVVNVRSASRVGRGDFGQNARNIRFFFEELDRQMREPLTH
jgi:uncharacterized protein (DUF1499 family)